MIKKTNDSGLVKALREELSSYYEDDGKSVAEDFAYDYEFGPDDYGIEEDLDADCLDGECNEDYAFDYEFGPDDYGIEEELEECNMSEKCVGDDCKTSITEAAVIPVDPGIDTSAIGASPMSESSVRSVCKNLRHGAIISYGYITDITGIAAPYAKGATLKDGTKCPKIVLLKKVVSQGFTGINYDNTKFAQKVHATQEYKDKVAAGMTFGHCTPDPELPTVLGINESSGKKVMKIYKLQNNSKSKAVAYYYMSVDGAPFVSVEPSDFDMYFTPSGKDKFYNPRKYVLSYQAEVNQRLGNNIGFDASTLINQDTGERIKIELTPAEITYSDPANPYKGIFVINRKTEADFVVASADNTAADATDIGDGSFESTMNTLDNLNG